jgi:hypothetical protein
LENKTDYTLKGNDSDTGIELVSMSRIQNERRLIVSTGRWTGSRQWIECRGGEIAMANNCVDDHFGNREQLRGMSIEHEAEVENGYWEDTRHFDVESESGSLEIISDVTSFTFKIPVDVQKRRGTVSVQAKCTLQVDNIHDPITGGMILICEPVRGVNGRAFPVITLTEAAEGVYRALKPE